MNQKIIGEADDVTEKSPLVKTQIIPQENIVTPINQKFSSKKVPPPIQRPQMGNVYRKSIEDPSRKYFLNFVYNNNEEIARFRSIKFDILDFEGEIPYGQLDFYNETNKQYGTERYKNNQRHGKYIEYYEDGTVRYDIYFSRGAISIMKEYFGDGQLRMEADYRDALIDSADKETGAGKIYYRDGTLMYEWQLTNVDDQRYKKAYNIEGELVETRTYDNGGILQNIVNLRDKE